ncbi:RAB6-interacting golgin [Aplysia californica]|uniref:RAB6-interacting golgin n=1 Tax=Aplysia californica TaxID=6500 RepID=A0ABM0JZX2_APLCA|nr:RAB6-interacting golgin [Aplysia californica]
MAGWSGFSDEDLRRMKKASPDEEDLNRQNARRQAMARKAKSNQQRDRLGRQLSNSDNSSAVRNTGRSAGGEPAQVDVSMKLSQSGKMAKSKPSPEAKENETTNSKKSDPKCSQGGSAGEQMNGGSQESKEEPTPHVADVKELNESEALNVELGNVHKFQQQQKMIEEANKHKRALLAKAIEDRRKKAKAEADKLMKVQQELSHLDSLLTADVSIIRDKIEVASLEYMDAQKRYEKAEKEFVSAKMDLFEKGDTKEQLTEHLYTIIHQNEVRKAKKLVELMEKLTMEVTPEEMELTIPCIPQLTNFTAVATLHDPHRPKRTSVSDDQDQLSKLPSDGKKVESLDAGNSDHIKEKESSLLSQGGTPEVVSPVASHAQGNSAETVPQNTELAKAVKTPVTSDINKSVPHNTDIISAPVTSADQVPVVQKDTSQQNQEQQGLQTVPSSLPANSPAPHLVQPSNPTSPSLSTADKSAKLHIDSCNLPDANSAQGENLTVSSSSNKVQTDNKVQVTSENNDHIAQMTGDGEAKPDQNGNVSSQDIQNVSETAPSAGLSNENSGKGWKLPFS